MSFINFKPPFIAHRGASALAPENTIAAFLKAKQLGANWIEFDVMLSADGQAVVIHDETLERTTNGKGNVCDYPYAYLRTLDAGSWFNPKFASEKIPLFRDVIQCVKDHNLHANVEIKALPGQELETVKEVLSEIKQFWTNEMHPPLISSFSELALRHVRQLSRGAQIGVLIDRWFDGWEELCDQLQSVAVDVNQKILDPNKVKMIHEMNRVILSYTVNETSRAQELFSWGVDAVFTDKLKEMLLSLPLKKGG